MLCGHDDETSLRIDVGATVDGAGKRCKAAAAMSNGRRLHRQRRRRREQRRKSGRGYSRALANSCFRSLTVAVSRTLNVSSVLPLRETIVSWIMVSVEDVRLFVCECSCNFGRGRLMTWHKIASQRLNCIAEDLLFSWHGAYQTDLAEPTGMVLKIKLNAQDDQQVRGRQTMPT
jgi:hypothetical protein